MGWFVDTCSAFYEFLTSQQSWVWFDSSEVTLNSLAYRQTMALL
jgi:hypothetical protein